MRVSVVVDDEDALDCSAHAKVLIIVLEALEAGRDGGVFLWLSLLCAARVSRVYAYGQSLPEGEVGERVKGDGVGHGGRVTSHVGSR